MTISRSQMSKQVSTPPGKKYGCKPTVHYRKPKYIKGQHAAGNIRNTYKNAER